MKKYFTALCMCWGNFCYIPGLHKWSENVRSLMLGWLPTVGMAIGLLWTIAYFLCLKLGLQFLITCFILTLMPFLLSGFIHVDGFMDVSDATLSRAPLEKKQLILKDSRVGAFAVIAFVFIVLGYYSAIGTALNFGIDYVYFPLICVLSRSVAGLEVLLSKPMITSQYAELRNAGETEDTNSRSMQDETGEAPESEVSDGQSESGRAPADVPEGRSTVRQGVVLLVIQLILYTALCTLLCHYFLATGLVVLATVLGTLIPSAFAKRSLSGMNGDIAGYSIVWGEFFGVLVLMLC